MSPSCESASSQWNVGKAEHIVLSQTELVEHVSIPSRFLRARKFDVQGAYAQFTSAEDWRRAEQIDQLYDSFSLPEFEMARQLYPQWTGRRDNSGLPVYVFEVASLTKEKTDPYSKDSSRLEPRIVALYEVRADSLLPFMYAPDKLTLLSSTPDTSARRAPAAYGAVRLAPVERHPARAPRIAH